MGVGVSGGGDGARAGPRSARAQDAQEPQRARPEVRKLTLSGVKHVDEHDLLKSISTQASKCRSLILYPICFFSRAPLWQEQYYLDESEFQRDVIRIRLYYWKHGYRETTVDTSVAYSAPREVHVTFAVTEGEPTRVRKISIAYDSTVISRIACAIGSRCCTRTTRWISSCSTRCASCFRTRCGTTATATRRSTPTSPSTAWRGCADVRLTLMQNRRTTVGTVTITGTQRVESGDGDELAHVQDRRSVPADGHPREPAKSVRVGPVPPGGDRRADRSTTASRT